MLKVYAYRFTSHTFGFLLTFFRGGLHVTVEGDSLNSSARPVMLTYLFCAKSGILHETLITVSCDQRSYILQSLFNRRLSLSMMACF